MPFQESINLGRIYRYITELQFGYVISSFIGTKFPVDFSWSIDDPILFNNRAMWNFYKRLLEI